MAYRRYRKRKNRYGGKRRWRNYYRGGRQLAKDVMYIKSLVNSELHYVDTSYTAQSVSSSGSVILLSDVGQGDTNSTRSGNSILPRYLNIYLKFENSVAVDVVRCMLFRWKDNSTPVIADIFENSSTPVYSPLNDNISGNKRDRKIDVIANKRILLGPSTYSEATVWKKSVDLNGAGKKFKDHVKFDDSSSTAPLGGIYLLLVGRQPTNTTDYEGNIKFSFHDN